MNILLIQCYCIVIKKDADKEFWITLIALYGVFIQKKYFIPDDLYLVFSWLMLNKWQLDKSQLDPAIPADPCPPIPTMIYPPHHNNVQGGVGMALV